MHILLNKNKCTKIIKNYNSFEQVDRCFVTKLTKKIYQKKYYDYLGKYLQKKHIMYSNVTKLSMRRKIHNAIQMKRKINRKVH